MGFRGQRRERARGRPLAARTPVYLLLHKPTGYMTTYKDPEGRPTVYDLIKEVTAFVSTKAPFVPT